MIVDDLTRLVLRAWRDLRRRPGYALAVVASLAIGIGANLAVFALVERTTWRELPFKDADRLIAVGSSRPDGISWLNSSREVYEWRAGSHALESVTWIRDAASGSRVEDPETALIGATAAANLLDVIGTRVSFGRWYTESEASESAPVVVVSDAMWRGRFGRDPTIIGRAALRVDGRLLTVIGVAPVGMELPIRADFWYPSGEHISVQVIARLRPGTSTQAARQELTDLGNRIATSKAEGKSVGIVVATLHDRLFGDTAPILRLFAGTVVLVLILACANVGNLCLVRALQRRHDLAVCSALGASRGRIVAPVLAENVVLVGLAMIGAIALSAVITGTVLHKTPTSLAVVRSVGVTQHTILFGIACAVGVILFVSWAPLLAALRADVRVTMSAGGFSGSGSDNARRLRSAFAIAQLSVALVLLIGCGLLARSMIRLTHVDAGFDRHGLVLARFRFVSPDNGASRQMIARQLAGAIRSSRGVHSAAVGPPALVGGHGPRLSDGFSTVFSVRDTTKADGSRTNVWVKYVDASYLGTFRIELLEGRSISDTDDDRHPAIALINVTAARMLFPGGRALGSRLAVLPTTESGGRSVTVVGILRDVRQRDLTVGTAPEVWLPIAQQTRLGSAIDVSFRADDKHLEDITRSVRDLIRPLATSIQLRRVATMDAIVEETLAPQRFVLTAFAALAAMALVLATIGVYAVIAYLTTMRTREIGIRIALGAQRSSIVALVARDGLSLVAIGILLGSTLAYVSRRAVAGFLFETSAWDSATVLTSSAVLGAAAIAAALVPARRAARLNPAMTLREE